MATLTNYRGLQVVTPDPTGDGGLAIQNDFKNLVQWNPKSSWNNTTSPTANDDSGDDFYPGSLWSRTNTTPAQLFLCIDSTPSAAVWIPIFLSSNAANGTLLIGNGTGFSRATLTGSVNQVIVTNSSGGITLTLPQGIATTSAPRFAYLGIGAAGDPAVGINVAGTISSSGTARGMLFSPTFDVGVSNPICVNGIGTMKAGNTVVGGVPNAYTFRCNDWNMNGNNVLNLFGYQCGDLTGGSASNVAFHGQVSAGTAGSGKYNLKMEGTATNYLNGKLGCGANNSAPTAQVDVSSTTEQLRLGYDIGTNYCSFVVGATGTITISPTGTNPSIILSPSGSGSVSTAAPINSTMSQTTLTGTTAGNIVWSQPMQGSALKLVVANATGYTNNTAVNQTITFSTAFAKTPSIISNTTGLTVTVSTTALTITAPNNATAYSGNLIIMGF